MMHIAYKKRKIGYDKVHIIGLAEALLYRNNPKCYVPGTIDPLEYLQQLLPFGVKAVATPIIQKKKVTGYIFKNRNN